MRAALPWIGEPAPEVIARPKCPNCLEPMRPQILTHYGTKEVPRTQYRRHEVEPGVFRMARMPTGEVDMMVGQPVSREFTGQYSGYGAFCSLRCCEAFANAAYRAGYRIKTD